MIDHRLRNERLIKEASDPETAVILIDVVLGYGAHSDPAAAMTPALAEARSINSKSMPIIIGFICGTEADPQNIGKQKSALIDNGVLVASCNAEAVRLASKILEKLK
jgi:FdrA protein